MEEHSGRAQSILRAAGGTCTGVSSVQPEGQAARGREAEGVRRGGPELGAR